MRFIGNLEKSSSSEILSAPELRLPMSRPRASRGDVGSSDSSDESDSTYMGGAASLSSFYNFYSSGDAFYLLTFLRFPKIKTESH